ncbi:MAG TPA: prolyl oligopeptidase family serine peptidase, partial [Opitutaceae bacterium]
EQIDRVADIFALGPDGDTLYIASRLNSDKFELDAFSMKEGVIKHPIARHPKYDMGGDFDITHFFYREKTGQLIGIRYNEEKPKIVWLDRHFAACQAAIDKALPDHVNEPIDYTDNGSTLLYFSTSDKDPGTYYIFRPESSVLIPVRTLQEHLKDKVLASMTPFTFQSRDGATIHAYLTEPVEKSSTPPPLIVDIHGGPSARDMWGFNPSTQFFASRGYAVLQVNYRGSAGYGAAYQKAGLRARLDTVVIDDVADGVKYLIEEKKADPTRIGVTGGSFGGYSVYMSLIKYPELYRAGVAIAAVAHWATLEEHNFLGDNFNYAYMHNLTGDAHFAEYEKFIDPYLRASEIKQPLYIMHGERDTTVRVQQAEMMYKAVKKTNPHAKLMFFGLSSHQYWNLGDRITLLNESGDFFAENLKPVAPAAAVAQK